MNKTTSTNYSLLENEHDLALFAEENKNVQWMGIDTEFVGERRFVTLLCLIQIATENGNYLIDTLKIKNIDCILDFVANPNIVKISHAGDNDYRLLYNLYGTLPKNIFDTQIAAGFVGYNYPISFRKLAGNEINVNISKGYTVSDWETRPIKDKQLKYALNDVLYLKDLWDKLDLKLQKLDRQSWVKEEFLKLETEEFYITDPNKEAINSNLMFGLNTQEQVFLVRLYAWRRSEAERKNYSKEMILSSKLIAPIVKNINSGRGALVNNRRIPNNLIKNHLDNFLAMYNEKITDEERLVLTKLPGKTVEDQQLDSMMDMLYLILTFKCHENSIAPSLVLHRSSLKKMKFDTTHFDEKLDAGWRKDLLGATLVDWFRRRNYLKVGFDAGNCLIEMK